MRLPPAKKPTLEELILRLGNQREGTSPTDLQLAAYEVEYNKGMRRPKDFARAHFSAEAPKWGRELNHSFCPSAVCPPWSRWRAYDEEEGGGWQKITVYINKGRLTGSQMRSIEGYKLN